MLLDVLSSVEEEYMVYSFELDEVKWAGIWPSPTHCTLHEFSDERGRVRG